MRNPHALELAANTRAAQNVLYTQDAKERTFALARLICYAAVFAGREPRFSHASAGRLVDTVFAIQRAAIEDKEVIL